MKFRNFCLKVTGGRPLPQAVIDEVKHRYGLIGQSPLQLTATRGDLLAQELGIPVYVGMRNWKPFIADTVGAMMAPTESSTWWPSAWRRRTRAPVLGSIARR